MFTRNVFTKVSIARSYSTVNTNVILEKALALVPQYGWKDSTVEVCRKLKMSDQATTLVPPEDLVKFHYSKQLENLRSYKPRAAPGFPRLKELLLYRLVEGNKKLGPGRLAEAIKIASASPLTTSFECLSNVSDELWYMAGDRSTDTRWYTRRGSLLGVYALCEGFQSRDSSRDFRDTITLAEKLLANLENVEYAEQSVGEWLKFNLRGTYNVMRTLR